MFDQVAGQMEFLPRIVLLTGNISATVSIVHRSLTFLQTIYSNNEES